MSNNRPNIIFLMTDQQRYDTFSCVNDEIKTPFLDELIEDSVHFKNAYCSNPSCVPSRAAIVTGKFPSECKCPNYIDKLPITEKTFMTRLQEAGYHTAVIGKQHFAGSEIKKGYDDEQIIDGHGAFAPRETIELYLKYLEENGVDKGSLVKRGLISGGSWNSDIKYHIDYFIGEMGKQWLQDKAKEINDEESKPWFFTLSFPGPHHPYDCEGTKYAELYDLEKLSKPESSCKDLDQKPPHFKNMGGYSKIYLKDYSEEIFLKTKRSYYANMSLIDEKIGEVIQVLKDNDMYDNTMIVYSSDHGDFMGDYGLVEKLQCLEDSLMRVPLFVKPPVKGFKGIAVDDEVINIDIAATCLDVAKAPIDKYMSNYPYNCYWDESKEKKVRDHIYMEAGEIKGCINKGIKTVHYMNRKYGEMYDLNKDPKEVNNIWDDPACLPQKLENYQIIVDNMFRSVPLWDVKWNIGTPEI
ncbi:sulfatase-like hydrolase/transferase [Clostridium grantii]|nr:sulfatase-like hydrolase/transferase [Clostridium grantii]